MQLEVERRTVRVETFIPFNPLQQTALQSQLSGRYGPGLQFTFQQNPALIGGLRVQIGSDVYDGSLGGKLNELQESF